VGVGRIAVHLVELGLHLAVVLGEGLRGAARALEVAARFREGDLAQPQRPEPGLALDQLDAQVAQLEHVVHVVRARDDAQLREVLAHDARELRERAMYAPSGEDRYKVYIVDEAHMLTREAWNALLKILEEPPPRVVFVFATTEPQKIAQSAAPVLSRLQRFDLKRISIGEIIKRLETVLQAEDISATGESLAMIARAADGSMRDALSLADQVISIGEGEITADRVREALGLVPEDEYLAIVDIIAGKRAGEIFETVRKLADGGVDFAVFLSGLGDMLRAQLAVVLGGRTAGLSPQRRATNGRASVASGSRARRPCRRGICCGSRSAAC